MEKIPSTHAVPRERNENKELRDAKFSLVQFLDGLAWEPINQFYQELVQDKAKLSEINRQLKDIAAPCRTVWATDEEGAQPPSEATPIPPGGEAESSGRDPESQPVKRPCNSQELERVTNVVKKMAKDERHTYRITLAYNGAAFCGFMKQKDMKTIQGTLEAAVTPLLPHGKNGHVPSAGRTDKGVHASATVISFTSWVDIPDDEIKEAIETSAPGDFHVHRVERVPRKFHATFSALWRRYVYLVPVYPSAWSSTASLSTLVEVVDGLLAPLRGREVDYYAFARDTPRDKDCLCTFHSARALAGVIPRSDGVEVLCVELVGNRFLRRQVRVTLSTLLMQALRVIRAREPVKNRDPPPTSQPEDGVKQETDGVAAESTGNAGNTEPYKLLPIVDDWDDFPGPADEGALLRLAEHGDRELTAWPAPAYGLCFAAVGYEA